MKMKERMTRLEVQLQSPPVNQAQIDEDAGIFTEQMERLVGKARSGDASMTMADRLAKMSVAEHVAWSVAFVPDFHLTSAMVDELMAAHARARTMEHGI